MPRKNTRRRVADEENVKQAGLESWQDPAMLQSLANLIKESVRSAIIAELKTTLEKNAELIRKLEAAVTERDKKIIELENKLTQRQDDLEQYQRRNYLRILGVPEQSDEETDKIVMETAAKIGVVLNIDDIDRSHRIGRQNNDRPRPVIVKFTSYRKRSEVFRSKRQLKGTGVTIREDLTKERLKLLQECITKYGLNNVWTLNGVVFCEKREC